MAATAKQSALLNDIPPAQPKQLSRAEIESRIRVAFGVAANPADVSYVRDFDCEELSQEPRRAIRQVVEAARSTSADDAARLLVVQGVQGSGKTHIVAKEFSEPTHPAYCVMVHRPEINYDYPKWLSQKLSRTLLRRSTEDSDLSSSFHKIAKTILDKYRRAPGYRPDASPFLRIVDGSLQIALDGLADAQGPGIPLIGGFIRATRRRLERERMTAWERFVDGIVQDLNLQGVPHAWSYCSTLALLNSPLARSATVVFSDGRIPKDIQDYVHEGDVSSWDLMDLTCQALASIGGCLVFFFDQLESYVDPVAVAEFDRTRAKADSLRRLLAWCIGAVQKNSNCGFVVSAAPEIANAAIETLEESDQAKILLPHGIPEIDNVAAHQAERLFEPRLHYLEKSGVPHQLLTHLREYVAWLSKNKMERPLPPRLLMISAFKYGTLIDWASEPFGEAAADNVWAKSLVDYNPRKKRDADKAPAEDEQSPLVTINDKWEEFESRYQQTAADVQDITEAADTFRWGLRTLAPSEQGLKSIEVKGTNFFSGVAAIELVLIRADGARIARTLAIFDQPTQHNLLLKSISDNQRKLPTGSILGRLWQPFPKTGAVRKLLVDLRQSKRTQELGLSPESMTVKQLKLFEASLNGQEKTRFSEWIRAKAFSLPALAASLSVNT